MEQSNKSKSLGHDPAELINVVRGNANGCDAVALEVEGGDCNDNASQPDYPSVQCRQPLGEGETVVWPKRKGESCCKQVNDVCDCIKSRIWGKPETQLGLGCGTTENQGPLLYSVPPHDALKSGE